MNNEDSDGLSFFDSENGLLGVSPFELVQGNRICNWNSDSFVQRTFPGDKRLNDVLFATLEMIPVFSERLHRSLINAGVGEADCQYLPLHVLRSTGEEAPGYSAANVITRVAALDRESCFMLSEDESEIDALTNRPKISAIGKIAIFATRLGNHDMARLVEYPCALLVSQRFFDVFREGKFTGAICSPLIISA
jgi:hypothetical protein